MAGSRRHGLSESNEYDIYTSSILDLAWSGGSPLSVIDRWQWTVFIIAAQAFRLATQHPSWWRSISPPIMGNLSTCRSSICNLFSSYYSFSKNFKVSNIVDPPKGEILHSSSGQSWRYPSDWRSYPSSWFGVPEVLHFPRSRSRICCCRSIDPDFWKKYHIAPKDSVLEEGSQLHNRRLQLPYVDRIHRHNSKSPLLLLQIFRWIRPLL